MHPKRSNVLNEREFVLVTRVKENKKMSMFNDLDFLLDGDEDLNPDGFGDMSVVATSDGCNVEPDGECEHGFESPLRRLGLI